MIEFRREKITKSKTVLDSDEVLRLIRINSESLAQNIIIKVDFSVIESFTDVNLAAMCLVVLSSDGALGTLTHLQVDADVPEFVRNLLNLYNGKPVSICLSGGSVGGETLINRVYQELKAKGFIVSLDQQHSSLGGTNIYREVTIFKERVTVKLIPYSGPQKVVELTYPLSN